MSPSRLLETSELYRIGVDVGGTNTDSALACASFASDTGVQEGPEISIIASHKSPTTQDVTTGICNSIRGVLEQTPVELSNVLSVNIGTTHFINAIIQNDRSKLARVAVIRICGPFCREVPPFADFPSELRGVIEGPVAYISGGLEIDGRSIGKIKEEEVYEQARRIKESGINTVVIIGVFSPLDTADITQEEQIQALLLKEIPSLDIVCSKSIGRIGFIERENASILNASILRFGRETVRSFQLAIYTLGLDCPLFLTQNDGTIMTLEAACATPIKTFSSGATNSLTGAIFLSGIHKPDSGINLETSQVIMCDIGGTSSDFAALSPSGFPRQSPAIVKVGGVRTDFSMPEVLSIGLGGGSRVHEREDGGVTLGPDSVGFRLPIEARCFGGSTLTATDVVVASGSINDINALWEKAPEATLVNKARLDIKKQLERGIDLMKTSDADVIALMVGGGSIIQMDDLDNVTRCIRPPFYNVANAVGAVIAKVSGEIDCIHIPGDKKHEEMLEDLKSQAISLAHKNGAQLKSIRIMELDLIPLQYSNNGSVRAIVKAVGSLEWSRKQNIASRLIAAESFERVENLSLTQLHIAPNTLDLLQSHDLESYVPKVVKATGEWFVSEIDLAFISEGCGVLGTGGGGSVHTAYLNSIDTLRSAKEGRMRIIEPESLSAESKVALVAYVGAPSVSNERLLGADELHSASLAHAKFLNIPGFDAIMAAEIGGSNGMRAFTTGATMDLPIVDGDTMGRAFPKVDMALPYVFGKSDPAPAVLSDARGNVQIIASVEDAHRFESMIRVVCQELGLFTAMSINPLSGNLIQNFCCHRGLSSAWFIGREIFLSRMNKTDTPTAIISKLPGGMKIYSGKIIDVSREVKGGWTIGTATLEANLDDKKESDDSTVSPIRPLVLQYQNEFLCACLQNPDRSLEAVCTTPDLLTVLDQDGSALGTNELRYGLRVSVIAMPADPLWKTEEGMTAGGPASFGLSMDYKPFANKFEKPESVIQRYGR